MEKMWAGRFSKKSAKLLEVFNASLEFDRKLYSQDIRGSIAHATMLAKQNIITCEERDKLVDGLEQVKKRDRKWRIYF